MYPSGPPFRFLNTPPPRPVIYSKTATGVEPCLAYCFVGELKCLWPLIEISWQIQLCGFTKPDVPARVFFTIVCVYTVKYCGNICCNLISVVISLWADLNWSVTDRTNGISSITTTQMSEIVSTTGQTIIVGKWWNSYIVLIVLSKQIPSLLYCPE